MMAVAVSTGPTLTLGPAEELFDAGPYRVGGGRQYDVTPDGQFLMIRAGAEARDRDTTSEPGQVIVIQNWTEELRQRVPVP